MKALLMGAGAGLRAVAAEGLFEGSTEGDEGGDGGGGEGAEKREGERQSDDEIVDVESEAGAEDLREAVAEEGQHSLGEGDPDKAAGQAEEERLREHAARQPPAGGAEG